MTVEQTPIRNQDWHLPSPSSTPTSSTFTDHLPQTPKTVSSPTHFLDAFTTPQVNGTKTPAQTPLFTFTSPTLTQSSGNFGYPIKQEPEDSNFHVKRLSPNLEHSLSSVESARRLSVSPIQFTTPTTNRKTGQIPSTAFKVDSSQRMDPSQIQTPPPTREGSSRRKIATSHSTHSAHRPLAPATTASRIMSTPVTAVPHQHDQPVFQTPIQFPSLQFSPDMLPFGNMGPMSAPTYPQQRLFWDQAHAGSGMELDMSLADDPFGPTSGRNDGQITWTMASPQNQIPMQTHQQNIFNMSHQNLPFSSVSGVNAPGSTVSAQQESFISTSGVDPSMLFSFNGSFDLAALNNDIPTTQPEFDPEGRQPYEQQMRESQMERERRELARQKRQQQQLRVDASASASSHGPNSRPSVQRSKTDGNFRRDASSSTHSRQSTASSTSDHIPRKSSPLKRLSSHGTLKAIPEVSRNRPRTRLVIDESGRARTETDPPVAGTQDPQAALRAQYPGLYDDDDSSDDENDRPIMSRDSSFAFTVPSRPSSKHARDSLGRSTSGSAKKARPTSFISLTKAFEKPTPEEISMRRYSMSSFGDSLGLGHDGAVPSPTDSQGDAQNALKAVREGRRQSQQRSAQKTLNAHNQRWSQAAFDMAKLGYPDPFTSSPTHLQADTNDFATPSTDRSSSSSDTTRCVCGATEAPHNNASMMIECESCKKWLHGSCVGINPQNVPSVYLCIFCTGSTPAVRNGRVREPARAPVNAYNNSPLNYKSMHRR